LAVGRPPPWRRGEGHGTTGTMVNPALIISTVVGTNSCLLLSNVSAPSQSRNTLKLRRPISTLLTAYDVIVAYATAH